MVERAVWGRQAVSSNLTIPTLRVRPLVGPFCYGDIMSKKKLTPLPAEEQIDRVRTLVRECTDLMDELDSALDSCERHLVVPESPLTTSLMRIA